MSIDNNQKNGHPPLAPEVADRLLDLLSSDDKFRTEFAKDPGAALQSSLGLAPQQTQAALAGASCLRVTSLASKEEVQAARDELRGSLTAAGAHTVVFMLEVGQVQASFGGGSGDTLA